MSETTRLSVDEFLEAEADPVQLAIVESVDDRPDIVRVTPWSAEGGCRCDDAFRVPKGAIASLLPTGDLHHCCGGAHRVCEVEWQDDAAVPVAELLAERRAPTSASHSATAIHTGLSDTGFPLPPGRESGWTQMYQELDPDCLKDCREHADFYHRRCWGRFSSEYCQRQWNATFRACAKNCYWLFPWRHPLMAPRYL